ncbi:UvrD-helicase domain-containing protein [Campylobacter fetus]|uniref:UvrD-helicase domain-containing protein n=1 Tax=Campylobacter fetus TaxID=196 RepID=UPI00081890A0|nr:UvrD-helicase domain-containing protein [Campylobacter fetus]EAH8299588.1 ATP-dependent helicase [Campylobacter fetus]EAI7232185.1 ATP-dependent helicase [Campylobacter fetus]EAJ5690821.1 ATP-dependent helicase [Campylobacter fetus]EAK0427692.1 ATP-dependent helicase [Campylobacter fetus]EAK5305039.1 ATP-dependent helicase [Campylobacter fetus]
MDNLLDSLNKSQKEAASHIDGAMLILAGAGSGKTKTITTRLAYLISVVGIDPLNTLTLTFTNKAASTMKHRALSMLNSDISSSPLLCTFHKFGLLFLKFYINELGRKNSFVIIDTDDKKKIIKEFESSVAASVISNEISKYKNLLLSVEDVISSSKLNAENQFMKTNYEKIAKAYKLYEEYLAANNLVDFDDLLALTYKILLNNNDLANEISNRYKYIMVDEYQDTNDLQYKLLRKLCECHENLVVVGDDDQSIYGWRGAKIENILNFKDQFNNVKLIKLEENYRSTPSILKAANELIDHNRSRLGKQLFSTKKDEYPIQIIENGDENIEARVIAGQIQKLLGSGVKADEIAILYRVNALSRSLEDGLNKARIPYKMVGGVKFYERMEIKDIISYLRLILNPNDDFSLNRIINRPKRGLGKVSLAKLEKFAYENKTSIYNAIYMIDDDTIGKKLRVVLLDFANELKELSSLAPNNLLANLEKSFGIKEYYKNLPDGVDRVANIDEFYALIKDQIQNDESFALEEFLNELALESEQDRISDDAISIMSVHASKGLEFEHLFVIGLEEGFFPLIGDGSDIEEERRLAYVAITRAKSGLNLSFSNSRFYKGQRARLNKSRFLSETGLCEGSLKLETSNEFKKGDLIKHKIFGIGRVMEITKIKSEFKLKINFAGNIKEIMSSFVEKVV